MKILSEQDIREKFAHKLDKKTAQQKKIQSEVQQQDYSAELKNYCMKLLVRRDYSVQELFLKAKAKSLHMEFFDSVIAALQQEGFQSNQRFCEAFVSSRIQKQMGPMKIKMELKQKGIADTVVDTTFRNLNVDWNAMARKLVLKKQKPLPENADFETQRKAKASLVRFLQSRGFESEQITFALKAIV